MARARAGGGQGAGDEPLVDWNFDDSLGTDRDKMRQWLGDTDETDKQLSDQQVAYFLSQNPNPIMAASLACTMLAAKYARSVSKTLGRLSVQAGDRMKHYQDLGAALRTQAMRGGGGCVPMYAGGLTRSQHTHYGDNPDRSRPAYKRGQFDEPQTGENSPPDDDRFGRC